jgi:hypothetical protein
MSEGMGMSESAGEGACGSRAHIRTSASMNFGLSLRVSVTGAAQSNTGFLAAKSGG